MLRFGRILLRFAQYFHFWHRHHLLIGLLLIVLGGVATIAASIGLVAEQSAGVPGEIEHVLGVFTIWFYGIYLGLFGCAYAAARIFPPRVVPFVTGLPEPLERSAHSHWVFGETLGPKFRFRFARSGELEDFIDYSAGDPAVFVANLDLTPEKRLGLYSRWQRLNNNAFMLLETRGEDDPVWRTFAISIVLPLSKDGVDELWSGGTRVIQLDQRHIPAVGHRPVAILIDTLIVAPQNKGREPQLLFALPKVHLSRFWVPAGKKRIEYWIEPDHKRLPKLLPSMGFEGPHEISEGHALFKLSYPVTWSRYSPDTRATIAAFLSDLNKVSDWHVE